MGWVYFFQEAPRPDDGIRRRRERTHITTSFGRPCGDGLIKIGFTAHHPFGRAREIASERHCAIVVLGAMQAFATIERQLHRRFADARVSVLREWFRPTRKLLKFIALLPVVLDASDFTTAASRKAAA